jgi:hypothetical protein
VPTPPSEFRDVEYWLKRAEEARSLAEEMKDAHTKSLMLGIAESYENIAKSYKTIGDYEKRRSENECGTPPRG